MYLGGRSICDILSLLKVYWSIFFVFAVKASETILVTFSGDCCYVNALFWFSPYESVNFVDNSESCRIKWGEWTTRLLLSFSVSTRSKKYVVNFVLSVLVVNKTYISTFQNFIILFSVISLQQAMQMRERIAILNRLLPNQSKPSLCNVGMYIYVIEYPVEPSESINVRVTCSLVKYLLIYVPTCI